MSEDQTEGAVLFADVCDSTGLYARLGDDVAHAMVGTLIEGLDRVVRGHGGAVIRSKGDDLLCTFPAADPGLEAAVDMLALSGEGEVSIHAGVHWGEFVHARGDIFGDAVNVAARLLSLATPGELITSEDLFARLSPDKAGWLRRIGRQSLKGKEEPVALFSLLSDAARTSGVKTTAATAGQVATGMAPRVRLKLRYGARDFEIGEGESLSIGRSKSCDCVIAHPSVSRNHASIAVKSGIVTIADSSSTGTFVAVDDHPPAMLRRNSLALVASGTVALGAQPDTRGTPVLQYRIERVETA